MKTIYDLSRDEMDELKEAYAKQLATNGISWGELSESYEIPDGIIFSLYAGIIFSDDDFVCNK